MTISLLYVDAGKGHYVPAKAISDVLIERGYDALEEDLFIALNSRFWHWYCKAEWRFFLKHPVLERIAHGLSDNRFFNVVIRALAKTKPIRGGFIAWYNVRKPEVILSTNFLGGAIVGELVLYYDLDVKVYVYAADAFNNPVAGFHPNVDKIFIPSIVGKENLAKQKYRSDQIVHCPFPLQQSIERMEIVSKEEARKQLGLADRFTILYNLGGEGIGSDHLIKQLVKEGVDYQIIVVGKTNERTKAHFLTITKNSNLTVHVPGFVSNIGLYILASDIQAGKAGANALMESIALRRPFLLSQVLYAARDTTSFFKRNGVGWVERSTKNQIKQIKRYASSEEVQEEMDTHFDNLPLRFSAQEFVDLLLEV